jgi:hypothetical protein
MTAGRVVLIPVPRREPQRPSENRLSMRAEHKGAVTQIANEAAAIAGAAAKIVQASQQALSEGGTLSIQAQATFLTGAYLRLLKDLGVVEHLQKHGTQQKKRPDVRR